MTDEMTGGTFVPASKENSIYNRRVRVSDQILKGLIYLAAAIAIAILIGIMGYVFVRGIPQISWEFLSTVQSSIKGTFGILGNIVNTLYPGSGGAHRRRLRHLPQRVRQAGKAGGQH